MKYNQFENSNFFGPERLIYAEETPPSRVVPAGASEVQRGRQEGLTGHLDFEEDIPTPLDPLDRPGADDDALAEVVPPAGELATPPETAIRDAQAGLETVRKRVTREIFDNEAEKQKYISDVREVLAENPNKWYEFVKTHQEYNGNWSEWNREFAEQVLGKTGLNQRDQRKCVGALQEILTEDFADPQYGIKFELVEGRRTNGFTYIDGMMGGYTVSVLGAYLTTIYEHKKPEWQRFRATLHADFRTGRRDAEYKKAIDHLERQLEGNFSAVPVARRAPEVQLDETGQATLQQLQSQNASNEAIFAFTQGYNDTLKADVLKAIAADTVPKDSEDPTGIAHSAENWATVHNLLTTEGAEYFSQDYTDAWNAENTRAAEVEEAGTPDIPAETRPETAKLTERARERRLDIQNLPANIQHGDLLRLELFDSLVKPKHRKAGNKRREMIEDDLHYIAYHDPDSGGWHDTINRYCADGSWPRRAYQEYRTAYQDWAAKKQEIDNMTGAYMEPAEEDYIALRDLNQKKGRAFKNLQTAIEEYTRIEQEIYTDAYNDITHEIVSAATEYEFPSDAEINLRSLYNNKKDTNRYNLYLPSVNMALPRTALGISGNTNISIFAPTAFSKYLNLAEVPTKTFKDREAFEESLTPAQKSKLAADFGPRNIDPFDVFNNLIYLNNLDRLANDMYERLDRKGSKSFNVRVEDERQARLSSVTYDQMLAQVAERESAERTA
ncbi:hypothetical protein KJ742_02360 [Patescibacteria group bacterium]|nr:hypothetical protein [Patescibacteria group bacterium]MBU1682764.1 hypothetical protein [Patescibacteria group bacterium]